MENDTFCIFFHHGGRFLVVENHKHYEGGRISSKDGFDGDRFGYLDLEEEVKNLGYKSWDSIQFFDPITDAFKIIQADREVLELLGLIEGKNRFTSVYVDNGILDNSSCNVGCNVGEVDGGGVCLDDGLNSDSSGDPCLKEALASSFESSDESDDESFNFDQEFGSETDDDLSDTELAEDDEEYVEARRNAARARRDKAARVMQQADKVARVMQQDEEIVPSGVGDIGHGKLSIYHGDNDVHSEYEDSDGEINSMSSGSEASIDEQTRKRKKLVKIFYDPKCDHKRLKFKLGMRFLDAKQCREAISRHALENGYPIRFKRSNKKQVEAKCIPECQFKIFASVMKKDNSFVVKTLGEDHSCPREMNNRLATCEWLGREYLEMFREKPKTKTLDIQKDMMKRFACNVSYWKAYRGRQRALKKLHGTYDQHYAKLRRYVAELMRVDPEGRFELKLGVGGIFEAFYVGFSSLRKGFIEGCRPIIGFDGCFLKAGLGGILLSAIGRDGNNQMFPIAWAVVEVENQSCWMWFLSILFEELNIVDGNGFTFISDQQKGLLNAIAQLTPNAEHRNCARHVYCNWKKTFKGITLKNIFWRIARSTYVEAFKFGLEELKTENQAAHDDFIAREPARFCKAFISTSPQCDIIHNNIAETFNGYILQAREKPIIDMLEMIRGQLMKRQYDKQKLVEGRLSKLTPSIQDKLDKIKFASRECICHPAIHGKFEIHHNEDQFVVNMDGRSCTCRVWDLTRIPCIHACCAITYLKVDPADYVASCYTVPTYKLAYMYGIEPLNGFKMWPSTEGYPVKPPFVRKMPGRPKKMRKKGIEEKDCEGRKKLPRVGNTITCRRCFQQGHNTRTCKNEAISRQPKPTAKRGRPFKNPSSTDWGESSQARGSESATNPSQQQLIMIEIAQARKGIGTFVGESGNIYTRMSSGSHIHQTNLMATNNGSGSDNQGVSRGRGRGRGGGRRGHHSATTTSIARHGTGPDGTQESQS